MTNVLLDRCLISLISADSVRLLNGSSLCSGGLQVKSNQRWSSVCEADFDLQDAEVVCRELGCGPPSLLQGALYGEAEAPVWSREFQCGGHESALLDCRSSGSARSSCSPGKAAGLTCSGRRGAAALVQTHFVLSLMTLRFLSEPVRLVGGASRCAGTLEVRRGEWRPVAMDIWNLKDAAVFCGQMNCGSAVSVGNTQSSSQRSFQCGGHESALLDCRSSGSARTAALVQTHFPVRLVGGASRCAGTLEVKQRLWRSVEASGWTLTDAPVACRELDCGSAVLTGRRNASWDGPTWKIKPDCVKSGSTLRECATSSQSSTVLELICSGKRLAVSQRSLTLNESSKVQPITSLFTDLLVQPIISVSFSSNDGHYQVQQQESSWVFKGSSFTISCSIQPHYPGGSFQLTFTSSNTTNNYTLPAVNHSAHFLFTAAEPAHQGTYSCVYHVFVFSHNFSSESRQLSLTVSGELKQSGAQV
uniref:SRCR domain-containing protein n=1 Tax=Pundamilia nyererei TaxID=303518 RepID=A0A3B4FYZ1_9CICH